MKYCTNCGTGLEEGAKVCPNCNMVLEEPNQMQGGMPNQMQGYNPMMNQGYDPNMQSNMQMPKKSNKKLIIGIVAGVSALVIVGIIILLVVLTSKPVLKLDEYVKVKFDGVDGAGTAYIDFDYDKYYEVVGEKYDSVNKDIDSLDDLQDALGSMSDYEDVTSVAKAFSYSLNKSNDLSNGDKVTVKFKVDEEELNDLGFKVEYENVSFTVKGLDKVKEVDVFSKIEISYEGIAPNVYINVENTSTDDFVSDIYFDVKEDGPFAEGDEFTVVANIDKETALYSGYKIKKFEKKFKVEGVDKYITKSTELNEAGLKVMKDKVESILNEDFADNLKYMTAKDLKYEGYYLLTSKEADTWSEHNIIYVVYSATVSAPKSEPNAWNEYGFDDTKIYFPVKFTDAVLSKDDVIVVDGMADSVYYIMGKTKLKTGYSTMRGYTVTSEMYTELVTGDAIDYDAEMVGTLN